MTEIKEYTGQHSAPRRNQRYAPRTKQNTITLMKRIESLLFKALNRDRYHLKQELIRIKRLNNKDLSSKTEKKLVQLEKKVQGSIKRKLRRKANLPSITYNDSLPIVARKDEIIEAISKNRVVIISGETGSGKTTQIPKFCLAAGRGIEGKIACTQPRRIAAITVAQRIAEELGEELGKSVGYKIRFTDKSNDNTYIKMMTDGILLAETQGDPSLREYDTIIVDEAHERSLNIDFVMGILKTLLRKRKDLKVIITSATIDTEKFSKAFDNAPVIEVSGRMYPVEVRYFPPDQKAEEGDSEPHVEMAVRAVDKLQQESPYGGDILVFMPTEQDIRDTCEMLEGRNYTGVTILPLFARLSASEQSRVFVSTRGRKIIVSTNVAETSLTIPGIRYVIDTGLARISQYLPASRTTALPVVPISRSSADQRKGRCGRVANGICIRLFEEKDYESRPLFTPPEILRSNLAEVILRMIALNLGDISDFPFVDNPAVKHIKDGFNLLVELGAIVRGQESGVGIKNSEFRIQDSGVGTKNSEVRSQESGIRSKLTANSQQPTPNSQQPTANSQQPSLTEKGRLMAKMPLDPRLSRMLIEAQNEGCVQEIAIIAAALSIQDPRERPSEKQAEADQAHAIFKDPSSDFITLLNIWNKYQDIRQNESTSKVKKFCKERFLSFKRMREWRDIHSQILEEIGNWKLEIGNSKLEIGNSKLEIGNSKLETGDSNFKSQISNFKLSSIHKSILSGFLSNIAMKKDKNIFQAAKGKEVMIFPGSGLFNKPGEWIVAAEMVETSRLFARAVANIDVNWLEPLGKEQCKYTYLDPHWERNRGEVVASEQVSLYGLIIIPKRPVSYGRINPDEASEIFIRSALVQGDVKTPFSFMAHNKTLTDEIREMENRIRRRDILISEEDMFQFYKERLNRVYDIRTLKKLLKQKESDDFLKMKREDLLLYSPDDTELSLYPEQISLGNNIFPCHYHFDPGKEADGVTVKIPSTLAPSVPSESLDWIVPGLLKEKITALIKGLPKEYRKRLVPVTRTVDFIINELESNLKSANQRSKIETSLISELGKLIYQHFKVDIPASAWDTDALPDHLKMRIAITGLNGKELYAGRDKAMLTTKIADQKSQVKDEFEAAKKEWEKSDLAKWDFGDLPDTVSIKGKSDTQWVAYPGLEPAEQSVHLRLFLHQEDALVSHKQGIVRLFAIHFSKDLKFLKKHLSLSKEIARFAEYFGGQAAIETSLYNRVLNDLFSLNIRTEKEFYDHAKVIGPEILKKGKEKSDSIAGVLQGYHEARSGLYELEKTNKANPMGIRFFQSLRDELTRLVPENFIELYETNRMIHLQRYIKAIILRAQRGIVNFEKDQAKAKEIKVYTDKLNELLKSLSAHASQEKRDAVEEYFWLIEEYKVSLFAQELKTAVPVSPKRLNQKLKEIERMI